MLGTLGVSRSALSLVVRRLHRPTILAPTYSLVRCKPIACGLHTSQLARTESPPSSGSKQPALDEETIEANKLLNWDEFFRLRKHRRMWERVVSLPCALLGLSVGAGVFATLPIDPQQMFFGFDPIIVFSASTVFCMVIGYALGPTAGRFWYRVGSPKMANALRIKEAEFFKHVKANRSDPSLSSASNTLPDFYGEKIDSLVAYRRWLRKQREHERKGTFKLGLKK
ncbi:TIM23 complex component [Coemansia sp. RSA 1813]|nr:TIM23 complex component [Coemansia sp. RSA 1646]KAJ1767982.1 TIM23 complex component [Coemansia sp. RSA 1843]KAJ2086418.1 TIM23 complex component [Coemansia sp. RSA 986]KAJ2211244.1 TIM23 complex component [Coemansia sp. RSA 487]KAJ2564472.1 TIM23 complex component [Coemansia sp. RSA 1813]